MITSTHNKLNARSIISLFVCLITSLACSGQSIPIVINSAMVANNIDLTFTASGTTITHGQAFTVGDSSPLKLQFANYNPSDLTQTIYLRTDCNQLAMAYNDSRIKTYDITINNINSNKQYFGKVAFFVAKPEAYLQDVTKSYHIAIPKHDFEKATNGQTAMVYEYYQAGENNYVTWIMWLSDTPFPAIETGETLHPNLLADGAPSKQSLNLKSVRRLHAGIAQTALAYGAFVPAGMLLVIYGAAPKEGESIDGFYFHNGVNNVTALTFGTGILLSGTIMAITGPIEIAHAVRKRKPGSSLLKQLPTIDLCVAPSYNPFNQAVGMGFNMQF